MALYSKGKLEQGNFLNPLPGENIRICRELRNGGAFKK
jgi:hypothetical protein